MWSNMYHDVLEKDELSIIGKQSRLCVGITESVSNVPFNDGWAMKTVLAWTLFSSERRGLHFRYDEVRMIAGNEV